MDALHTTGFVIVTLCLVAACAIAWGEDVAGRD